MRLDETGERVTMLVDVGTNTEVVLAGREYPDRPDSGSPIEGIEAAEAAGALVFHAGTALHGSTLVTNGGRILGVTGLGETVATARTAAYDAADCIAFAGARLSRHKRLHDVRIVDSLPRLPSGKLQRRVLRAATLRRVGVRGLHRRL